MKEFHTAAKILQGNTLVPYLFVIAVDYNLRQFLHRMNTKRHTIKPSESRWLKGKYLTDLDYLDDIALTADHLQDAQDLLICLEDAAAKVGLFLNAKRTEYVMRTTMKFIRLPNLMMALLIEITNSLDHLSL